MPQFLRFFENFQEVQNFFMLDNQWEKIAKDIVSPEEISEKFNFPKNKITDTSKIYPFKINRYYFSLIKEAFDPVWIQSIPDEKELLDNRGCEDPFLEDDVLSPVPGLVHRYDDRVILLVTDKCAMYCRHCMRKRRVGIKENNFFENLNEILNYLKNHQEISDIILSGGDPLLIPDEKLEFILEKIREVKKDAVIRIHTRTICTLPHRITDRLCSIIKKFHPVYVNTHFNHWMEITDETSKASAKLADSGIQLGCQTVFLKGVNDDEKILGKLFTDLLKIRIKPYYLHHPDPIKGISHLKPDFKKGMEIMGRLRGRISGMAIPHYMIDLPDGGGKVPVLPEYIKNIEKNFLMVENYKGKLCRYPL